MPVVAADTHRRRRSGGFLRQRWRRRPAGGGSLDQPSAPASIRALDSFGFAAVGEVSPTWRAASSSSATSQRTSSSSASHSAAVTAARPLGSALRQGIGARPGFPPRSLACRCLSPGPPSTCGQSAPATGAEPITPGLTYAVSRFRFGVPGDSRADRRGNLHPAEQRPEQKIDAAVALMMAIRRAMAEDASEGDLEDFLRNPVIA